MLLRKYQLEAISSVLDRFSKGDQRTLLVAATGTGKTVIMGHLANEFIPHGRVLLLVHREELLRQGAEKMSQITGLTPSIEKADEQSIEWGLGGKPPMLVSTFQTQYSGNGKR